jgi:hypothetical protein
MTTSNLITLRGLTSKCRSWIKLPLLDPHCGDYISTQEALGNTETLFRLYTGRVEALGTVVWSPGADEVEDLFGDITVGRNLPHSMSCVHPPLQGSAELHT